MIIRQLEKRNDLNALSKSENDFDKFTTGRYRLKVKICQYVNIVIYSLEGGLKLGIVRD